MTVSFFDSPPDIKRLVFFSYLKPVELLPLYSVNKATYALLSLKKFKISKIYVVISIGEFGSLTYLNWITNFFRITLKKDKQLAETAANNGKLNFLKGLNEQGYAFSSRIFNDTIHSGHLPVLQWLHEIGYKGDKYSTSHAILMNRLDMLQWLREEGYPINFYSQEAAKHRGISLHNT